MKDENIFSIGEIARLTGVTIRTLQYYDNIGLVPLDKKDIHGRRYFRESDISRLQQVMFYKSMGLKINKIKDLLSETITPQQFLNVLNDQKYMLIQKMNDLNSSMAILEASVASIDESKTIPWGNLIQMIILFNKETIFKYNKISFDDEAQNVLLEHYKSIDTILKDYWEWKTLVLEAISHTMNKVEPKSNQGQEFAKKWNNMVQMITNKDEELLEAHKTSYENRDLWPDEDKQLMEFANNFIDEAMAHYKRNEVH
ncbi:MAG: MerR family transcriptional regulator [Tissierella sp.]|nr:MerR family transcriptional regulator [Tissierella sp.]